MNLTGLCLEDTDLSQGSFIGTNLESSIMRRVNITSANFTVANLLNINWRDMDAMEVQIYEGHTDYVLCIAISPSGEIIASSINGQFRRFLRLIHKTLEFNEW